MNSGERFSVKAVEGLMLDTGLKRAKERMLADFILQGVLYNLKARAKMGAREWIVNSSLARVQIAPESYPASGSSPLLHA